MLIGALVKDWSTKCLESVHAYKPFYAKIAWKAYCPMPLPYELMDNYITVCKATTSKGAKNLDEMVNIDDKDKDELFKTNADMVTVFKEATFVDEENYGFSQLLGNAVMSNTIEIRDDVENAMRKYRKLELREIVVSKLSKQVDSVLAKLYFHFTFQPVIKYEQLHVSPWTSSLADEERHKEIIWKIKKWLYLDKESNKPDDVLVVLGLYVIYFNSSFVNLSKRDVVEKAQMKYLTLLKNYLNYKLKDHTKSMAKFTEFMRVLIYVMEGSEIIKNRLPF